jgi:hypothetical protein
MSNERVFLDDLAYDKERMTFTVIYELRSGLKKRIRLTRELCKDIGFIDFEKVIPFLGNLNEQP